MSLIVLLPAFDKGLGDNVDALEYLRMDLSELLLLAFPMWKALGNTQYDLTERDLVRDTITDHIVKRFPGRINSFEQAMELSSAICATLEQIFNTYAGILEPLTTSPHQALYGALEELSLERFIGADMVVRLEPTRRTL